MKPTPTCASRRQPLFSRLCFSLHAMSTVSAPHEATRFDPDYFPARLNAPLNAGRYRILRKLGEGVSSSSWVVHDENGEQVSLKYSSQCTAAYLRRLCNRPGYKYLAAKILTLDATQRHRTGQMRELEFLQEITAQDDTDYLPLLRDNFVERGPRGEHLCLLLDLYSTSVSALRRSAPHKALPPYIVRNIIMMLVEALVQLRSLRIVHTGRCIARLDEFHDIK